MHGREGAPEQAIADLPAGRRPPGVGPVDRRRRRWRAMCEGEWVGRRGDALDAAGDDAYV